MLLREEGTDSLATRWLPTCHHCRGRGLVWRRGRSKQVKGRKECVKVQRKDLRKDQPRACQLQRAKEASSSLELQPLQSHSSPVTPLPPPCPTQPTQPQIAPTVSCPATSPATSPVLASSSRLKKRAAVNAAPKSPLMAAAGKQRRPHHPHHPFLAPNPV